MSTALERIRTAVRNYGPDSFPRVRSTDLTLALAAIEAARLQHSDFNCAALTDALTALNALTSEAK